MRPREVALALCVVLLWGGSFTVIKLGLQDVPPMLLGALRYLLSAFPALLWFARPRVPWRWWLAYGFSVGVGQFALLFWAVRLGLPAGVASVALQTQAFFTMLFAAAFLGEALRPAMVSGLLIAAAALALLVQPALSGSAAISPWAHVLVLGAASCWAASNIVLRKAARATPGFDMMAFIVWTSLIPPLPFALLSWATGERVAWHGAWPQLSGLAWASVLYLAVGGTLLGNGIFSWLLTRYPAGRIASFTLLVPVAGLGIAVLGTGETLSTTQWLACGLVVLGLVVSVGPRGVFRGVAAAAPRTPPTRHGPTSLPHASLPCSRPSPNPSPSPSASCSPRCR